MLESENKDIMKECPKCNSSRIHICGAFWNKAKCEKCGWEGSTKELI
jgi:predicted RNA-binding Zn-ribbon protein involved in translation (DUF1610 family)